MIIIILQYDEGHEDDRDEEGDIYDPLQDVSAIQWYSKHEGVKRRS